MRAPSTPPIGIPELSNTWDAPTLDVKKPKDPKLLMGLLQAVQEMSSQPPASAPLPPMQTDNIAQRAAAMNQYQQFQQPQYPGFRYGGDVKAKRPIVVGENGPEVIVPKTDAVVIPNAADVPSPFAAPSAQVLAPHQVAPQPIAIPTVTAPAPLPPSPAEDPLKDTGWASYTPEMAAQRDYNENRPPTVDEAWKNYDTVNAKKEHPNKFLSGLFLALQGLNKFANPNDKTPVTTLGDAQRNKKMAEAKAVLDSTIGKDKYQTDKAYKEAQTQYQLERPEIAYATIAQRREASKAVTGRLQMNIDFRKGEAKPYIDENGKVWKQYLKDPSRPMEPLENPITHEQEFVPGEEGIQWKDPNTGKTITIKAKQSVQPSATIAAGNANRQTTADRDNAQKIWDTDNKNISNFMEWQKTTASMLTTALGAEADPALAGTNERIGAIANELNDLYNSPLPEGDTEKAQKERIERVNKLVDESWKLREDALNTLSKSEVGKAKAAEIRKNLPPRPPKLSYTPYKPTVVSGGVTSNPVPKGKDPLGLFQP